MTQRVRIATRSTPLALIQTDLVAEQLRERGLEVERVELRTLGDRSLGGNLTLRRGMFTAELDRALLDGRADLAVHSLKDLPVELDPRLDIVAIPERASPCDLLLQRPDEAPDDWQTLDALLEGERAGAWHGSAVEQAFSGLACGAVIGTSSPRRQTGALAARPDLVCCAVRGSVGRRLEWLESRAVDGLLLAEAGLARLARDAGNHERFGALAACRLEPHAWPPAPGQGALAIVAASSTRWCEHEAIVALSHPETSRAVRWERALLKQLGGGCSLPFAAYHDGSFATATLAAEEWRDDACRGHAPRIGRAERSSVDRDLADTGRSLRTLVAPLPSPTAPPSVAGPPELIVTSSPEATARLTASLADTLGRAVKVADFAVTRTSVKDIEWPSERARQILAAVPSRRRWPWVLVSSPNAARILADRARLEPEWSNLPWCALGAGTARALIGLGCPPNLVASSRNAEGLATFAGRHLENAAALFLPQSDLADGTLHSRLVDLGFEVHAFSAYTQQPAAPDEWPAEWGGAPERMLFTSPSAVNAVADSELRLPRLCWAIGDPTARAMKSQGIPVAGVADTPTARGVAALWL